MASKNIKGITIEIGGDTTGLTKALSGVDKQLKNTQSELKAVEKKLKLDPTNTELLAEKQRLLNEAVKQTQERMDTLKTAAEQAKEQLEAGAITQEQYDGLQKEISETADALQKAKDAAESFNVGLEKAKASADKVSKSAKGVADATKGLSAAAAGVIGALGGAALNAVRASDDLNTLAKQSGLTTEEIQKFQYAADLIDVSANDIIGAQAKLTKSMTSTSTATQEAFSRIGVSVTDANGELKSSSDVFYEVLEGLSQVTNETERDALAMDIFGKSAASLTGIIDDGGAALKELGDQASELGVIMDQETLDSLNAVNDQLDTLKANAQGQIAQAGAKAMEALMPIFEELIGYMSSAVEWIGSLDTDTIKIILTIAGLVAAISPIAGIIASVTGAVGSFLAIWPQLKAAGLAAKAFAASNPIVLIGAAVAAMVALIIANWDKIRPVLDTILGYIKSGVNGILGIINGLIDGINRLIGGLNKLRISPPKWFTDMTGVGQFGLNIPTIPKIPLLANGGILASGSAIVGEAGAELLSMTDRGAVVQPLTTNNTTNNYNSVAPAVDITFTGNLAQLARVLQPHIAIEQNRRG